MHLNFHEIDRRIRHFMRRGGDEEEFNELALGLYSLQQRENSAYASLCQQRQVCDVKRWQDIPAVPTVAFKQLELTSLSPSERVNVFFSSGTTQQDRSRHYHSAESLGLYEESLWLWFERVFGSERENVRFLFLTPDAKQAPNSSLAHMFSAIAARQKGEAEFGGIVGADGAWQLDWENVLRALTKGKPDGKPLALFGTAFLFVNLLDEIEKTGATIRLPENSWVLETGGYKGRSREVPKEELHRLLSERLGIAREQIFGEYGMSELSSQAYARADGLFRFPPWARARMISPATGREAGEGERGLIRVYDLANVWSVMAVQTEDIGIKVGEAFRLAGRAAEAEARGCSLMTV